MREVLEVLEAKKKQLLEEIFEMGDFRRGTISVNYRRCGKRNCVCAREGHAGHGPQYLWNATIGGKSRARNLRLGPELEKFSGEVGNYRRLVKLFEELVGVSEQICALRPVREVRDEKELERLKKKLRKQFSAKSGRK